MKLWKEESLMNFLPWRGAQQVYHYIDEHGKVNELEDILTELYPEGIGETLINDILWFESEWLFEWLRETATWNSYNRSCRCCSCTPGASIRGSSL